MAADPPNARNGLRFTDLHAEVQLALDLYEDGHFQEAVRTAAQRFNNRVAEKAEREDLTGQDLMNHVFSTKKPVLVFSEERATLTEKDLHDGYRSLASGLAAAIRNVYTHQDHVKVTQVEALEWLAFISAMHRRLDRATQFAPAPSDPAEQADASEPEDEPEDDLS